MTRNPRLLCAAAGFLITALGTVSANAEDPACKPIFDAMTKLASTPSHTFMTKTVGAEKGAGKTSETINTGATRYLRIDGSWMASPLNTKALLAQAEENRRDGKEQHCSYLREEAIIGEAAGVYIAHNKSEFGTSDERVWISKHSGLPLKDEIDLSSGGPQDVTHYASRYVYDGVRAPDGVTQ